jgi:hypothetical protein
MASGAAASGKIFAIVGVSAPSTRKSRHACCAAFTVSGLKTSGRKISPALLRRDKSAFGKAFTDEEGQTSDPRPSVAELPVKTRE